ncbi:MAG: hypothetical protein ACFFKA_11650, partial [Candidatus Thorarchaeota archaeon]
IIGGIIYSEEEITEAMLKEVKISKNVVKMGRLNNGFTFFDDRNYSTRLIIKDRAIQAIELFVDKSDKPSPLKVKPPLILDDKLSKTGRIEDILRAFKIPDSISDLDSTENQD